MKYIKQKSTNKIIHREDPHEDSSLDNASLRYGIDVSDLEVTESDWTDDQWTAALRNQVSYDVKRKEEYDLLNQFEMQFDDQRDGTSLWVDAINSIKAKFPKEVR
jgi:hypothetical protein